MKRPLSVGLALAFLLLPPGVATADSGSEPAERSQPRYTRTESTTTVFAPGLFSMAFSPYTSSTSSTSTTTAGIVGMSLTTTRALLPKGRACPQAVAYLRENHRDLQEGLLLGGGEVIDELAFLTEVPKEHHERFAIALRDSRERLLPHLFEDLDVDEATAFLYEVLNVRDQLVDAG